MSVSMQDTRWEDTPPPWIVQRFLRLIAPWWVPILILLVMISIAVTSIYEADWVPDSQSLAELVLVGAILGILLALSHLPGWFIALYLLIISPLAGMQEVGRIVPPINLILNIPFSDLLRGMNVRALTLLDRVISWWSVFSIGENNIEDTGLFVFLVGLATWFLGGWMMWFVLRKKKALIGIVPYGILLAVNVHLSQQSINGLWVFFILSLLLVAQNAYSAKHIDWDHRQVDYPWDLNEWPVSAVFIVIVIAVIARILPFIGTPEGWQRLSELVNKMHEQTSDTATRLFANVNPPKVEGPEVIRAAGPNMRDIGTPISSSSETVLWVTVSDPPPPQVGPRFTGPPTYWVHHYYRNAILANYDGRGWDPPEISESSSVVPTTGTPPGRYILEQGYDLVGIHGNLLYGVNEPVKASETDKISYRFTKPDNSMLLKGNATHYKATSWAAKVTATQLRRSGVNYPINVKQAYLQLPDELPERVRLLAQRVTSGLDTPYDKAVSLERFLRSNYPYRLDVGSPPAGRDAVDYFLFDIQAGFCSYYSSAMVVMLRVVGVPARVVIGYATGEFDYERHAYRVPASAAHAWVEVYFPTYGWIEFEPTAAYGSFQYVEETTSAGPNQAEETIIEKTSHQGWIAMAVLIVTALFSILVISGKFRWPIFRFGLSKRDTRVQSDILYRNIRRALDRAGLHASASTTPAEFYMEFSSQLSSRGLLVEVLRQATNLYTQAFFSPNYPHPGDIQITRSLWQQAWLEWFILWIRYKAFHNIEKENS